jgi:hypothetical protein
MTLGASRRSRCAVACPVKAALRSPDRCAHHETTTGMKLWQHARSGHARDKSQAQLAFEPLEARNLLAAAPWELAPIGQVEFPISTEPAEVERQQWHTRLTVGFDDSAGAEDEEEDERALEPQEISGAFLHWNPADFEPLSFDDVLQGQSDTCAFTSVLSAVARTDFDLLSGINYVGQLPNGDYSFNVRLFVATVPGAYAPIWVNVDAAPGPLSPEDLKTLDEEYWPALYLRAYLQHQDDVDGNYRSIRQSFESLTGMDVEQYLFHDDPRGDALYLRSVLLDGRPVAAATIAGPAPLESQFGLIGSHCYTVLGVEVPTTGDEIYVTLRNPWGRDTSWRHFDSDDNGMLSTDERTLKRYGIDGSDDGIIRITWTAFANNFQGLGISTLDGPSINSPQPVIQPYFLDPEVGPFTIREGETLGPLALTAVNPGGDAPYFRLYGLSPGYVQLQSGQYTWEAPAGSAGLHHVTVIAEVNPYQSVALTFIVNVDSGVPTIGGLGVSPGSITDSGTDIVTVTATNVSHAFDAVDFVEFWRDKNGDGILNKNVDVWLARDENAANGWSYTGPIGGVAPGTISVFAQAGRYSFSSLHLSLVKSTPLVITAAPVIPPVAVPLAAPQIVSSTGAATHSPFKVVADAQGNYRVFYWSTSSNRFFSVRYNADGVLLNSAAQLNLAVDSFFRPLDVTMMADGTFAVAYILGDSLRVGWYSAIGGVLQTTTIATISVDNPHVQVAADRDGNVLVVYQTGDYSLENVYAVSVARNGTITRAPWRLNTNTSNSLRNFKNPVVALNADGNGIVVWKAQDNTGGTNRRFASARFISNYGLSAGAEFEIGDIGGTTDIADLYAVVNSVGDMAVSYPLTPTGGGGRRYNASGPVGAPFASLGGPLAFNDLGWLISTGTLNVDPDASSGVFAQLYEPGGGAVGPRITVPTNTTGSQTHGGVIMGGDADFVVAWSHTGTQMQMRRFGVNLAPQFLASGDFSVAENSAAGTLVGTISASDPDPLNVVQYRLIGDSPFVIDSATGALRIAPGAQLDHEEASQYSLVVEISDNQSPALSRQQTQIINVTNVNEPPQVQPATYSIAEHSPLGAIVGAASALDPESGSFTFSIIGSSPFAIDPTTGVISVANPVALDMDAQAQYVIVVAAIDAGQPAQQGTASITINLTPGTPGDSNPPLLGGLPARVHYNAPNASLPLAAAATISDGDSANMVGGVLRVQIANSTAADEFLLGASDDIAIDGANVRVNDVLVGVVSGNGQHGTPLEIVLHSGATPGRVESLLRAVHYRAAVAALEDRLIILTLNDGAGGQAIVQVTLGPPSPADFNGDGNVNGDDFLRWQRGLGTESPFASKLDGDADNDRDVDADDLAVWKSQFGNPTPAAELAITTFSSPSVEISIPVLEKRDKIATDAVFAAGDFTRLFAAPSEAGVSGSRNYRPRRRF